MSQNKVDLIPSATLDAIGEFYTSSPTMRALVALAGIVPIVTILDEAVVKQWEKAKAERFRLLLEELQAEEKLLTDDLIQSEDFIFAFISVTRASIFTRRKEKIKLFGQMLKNACRRKSLNYDEFEENLKVLDELSLLELDLLLLYKKHEDILKERHKTKPGDYRKSQWEAFANDAEKDLSMPREYLSSAMSRITRTGLYELYTWLVADDALGNGRITAKCIDFLNWLIDESAESA